MSSHKISKSLFQDALVRPLTACAHTHTDTAPWVSVSQAKLRHSFMLRDTLTGLVVRINESPLASCAASLCGMGAVGHGTSRVSMLRLCPAQEGEHRIPQVSRAELPGAPLAWEPVGRLPHLPFLSFQLNQICSQTFRPCLRWGSRKICRSDQVSILRWLSAHTVTLHNSLKASSRMTARLGCRTTAPWLMLPGCPDTSGTTCEFTEGSRLESGGCHPSV